MNKFRAVLVSAILLLIPIGVFAQQSIEGIWQGVLKVQSSELRIVFKISPTPEGKLNATLDSPDQGAKDIEKSQMPSIGDQRRERPASAAQRKFACH